MRFQWTGIGVVVGAALGLLLGQMVFDGAWWAPIVGVSLGLVIGAVADGSTGRD